MTVFSRGGICTAPVLRDTGIATTAPAPGIAVPSSFAQVWPCDAAASLVVRYGLMWSSMRPGRSTSVESISKKPGGALRTMKAVPRTSVMFSIGSRRASRCAISMIARSALPYSSRSALLSTRIERRTLSCQ